MIFLSLFARTYMYANKYTFLRLYLRDCSEIILKKKKKLILILEKGKRNETMYVPIRRMRILSHFTGTTRRKIK